jgi:transposase
VAAARPHSGQNLAPGGCTAPQPAHETSSRAPHCTQKRTSPGDDTDRRAARKTLSKTALAALAGRELPAAASREQAIRHAEIRRLARALDQARHQLKDNRAQPLAIVEDIAPRLTSRYGVGPVSAAQAIVSFSHPGRCRSEAAFASLGGTSPLPASSGRTIRHRLNRGGDRAFNRAIHAIALTRIRSCPRTRAYITRRTTEGKTPRESAAASSATSPANSTGSSTAWRGTVGSRT